MKRHQSASIKALRLSSDPISDLTVEGWVRTRRDAKGFSFLELNDGSCLANLQVVVDETCPQFNDIHDFTTGSAVRVQGHLIPSTGKGQKWELKATSLLLVGPADESYPLQKKRHSPEYLREIAHLRPRSNLFGAIFRVRSRLAYAVHKFFQERDFLYVHTPLITASDCEGAGEMFRVTSLDPHTPPRLPDGSIDTAKDFFGRPTFLTVSGQLEAEIFALSHKNVYTFGPTFRAENSNTSRHASEFWMIEPEMAFCDLAGDMDLAESFIKELIKDALQSCEEDLAFFNQFVDPTLLQRLQLVVDRPFQRISYAQATDILISSAKSFSYPVSKGANLQSEHERFLTEEYFKGPITVHDYPATIKPFYMRLNDDRQTVAAMDVLVPGIGEIIGGSQREERLPLLDAALHKHNLSQDAYWWYRDLRKFGSAPHAGFGLGFERVLMFISGIPNIRDVIPFARTPGNAEF